MKIHPLVAGDLPQIQQIYAHHVLHGTGFWELETPSPVEMTDWAQAIQKNGLPYLVAEVAEQIVGYAYGLPIVLGQVIASPWKIRFISIRNSASKELGCYSCRS